MRSLATLVTAVSGEIAVNGKRPDDARKAREVGFVFQSAGLLEWRDAERNIMLPLELEGLPKAEARVRAEALLERVGLTKFRHHYPRQMSGGMQQRVSIARALSTDPGILLMDEPFAALDEITRERMNAWLIDLWTARGFTVVFVTHNIREAILLSDRIVVMAPHPGRIIGDFTVDLPRPRGTEVRDSPEFREVRRLGERLLGQAMTGEVDPDEETMDGGGDGDN
jgi:NitT/TauT family transport system ATP-binding protein